MTELLLRARPTTVIARQVTLDTRDQIIRWINDNGGHSFPFGTRGLTWVRKGGGIIDAKLGDWVVLDGSEFSVVPDDTLYRMYDRVVPVVSE